MNTITHSLRFAAGLTAVLMLMPWESASSDAPTTDVAAPSDMVSELRATGPNTSLGSGAELLGKLVGHWRIDYTFHSRDGKASHASGEYLAGWVMDGRAVQSIWTVEPHGGRKDREIYTSLHCFDPKSGTMYLTFIDPEHASPDYPLAARFAGAAEGDDRIVIQTQDLGGKDNRTNRWSFGDIGTDSFVFRDEQSSDGGKTWRLLEEDRMTRRDESPAMAAIPNAVRPGAGSI